MAREKMHGKIRRLEEALECSFFTDEHAAVLAMMLAVIDHHTAQISQLTATIDKLAEPYLPQIGQPGAALGEAAISGGNTQSFLGARYRKLTRRMLRKKALVATGNSMLTIIHALLSDPAAVYTDLCADYYEQRMHARRQARNHVKSLERLGYKVTIEAIDPATRELTAAS